MPLAHTRYYLTILFLVNMPWWILSPWLALIVIYTLYVGLAAAASGQEPLKSLEKTTYTAGQAIPVSCLNRTMWVFGLKIDPCIGEVLMSCAQRHWRTCTKSRIILREHLNHVLPWDILIFRWGQYALRRSSPGLIGTVDYRRPRAAAVHSFPNLQWDWTATRALLWCRKRYLCTTSL